MPNPGRHLPLSSPFDVLTPSGGRSPISGTPLLGTSESSSNPNRPISVTPPGIPHIGMIPHRQQQQQQHSNNTNVLSHPQQLTINQQHPILQTTPTVPLRPPNQPPTHQISSPSQPEGLLQHLVPQHHSTTPSSIVRIVDTKLISSTHPSISQLQKPIQSQQNSPSITHPLTHISSEQSSSSSIPSIHSMTRPSFFPNDNINQSSSSIIPPRFSVINTTLTGKYLFVLFLKH